MFKILSLILWLAGLGLLFVVADQSPLIKLLAASAGLLFFVKLAALCWQFSETKKAPNGLGLLAFLFGWPGVRVDGFLKREKFPAATTGERFLESWLTLFLGIVIVLVAAYVGRGQSLVANYAALFGTLCIVHLGLVEVVLDGWRLLGFTPQTQFDRPFLATSLRDFWSHRWNLAFVDMNKIFLLKPLKNKLPKSVLLFFIFAVSGVLHELAISYPSGASWGLPLLYFLVQGTGVVFEKTVKLPRVLVLAWVILPAPILFPPAFVNEFFGGLSVLIVYGLELVTVEMVWKYGLLLGGFLHLCVLIASVQVPKQLHWSEELGRLRSLNRKVFWTYGVYIFSIIVFMSAVSFFLAQQPISGGSSLLWLIFVSLFWWARIGIDFLYMKHSDWPEGPLFKVGHVCLSTLFLTLCILYSGLVSVSLGLWKAVV